MHDPLTMAFEIKYPWRKYGNKAKSKFDREYRAPFITIWHKDPCKRGNWRSDDSCGWFIRAGHCDQEKINGTIKDFDFEWCNEWGGWFNEDGTPRLSVMAITLGMFSIAAKHHFGTWDKSNKFMKKNLYEIVRFAENNIDSLFDSITGKYGFPERSERIKSMAEIVYPWVARSSRPWYKHPCWHIHHWEIQFHPWQNLKRRYWTKCSRCNKRGFKGSAVGNWSGTEIWHEECDGSMSAALNGEKHEHAESAKIH